MYKVLGLFILVQMSLSWALPTGKLPALQKDRQTESLVTSQTQFRGGNWKHNFGIPGGSYGTYSGYGAVPGYAGVVPAAHGYGGVPAAPGYVGVSALGAVPVVPGYAGIHNAGHPGYYGNGYQTGYQNGYGWKLG